MFVNNNNNDDENNHDPAIRISQTLRRAFRDKLEQELQFAQSYHPLYPTLRELHGIVRGLVPNRTDFHGLLNDNGTDDVRGSGSGGGVGGGEGGGGFHSECIWKSCVRQKSTYQCWKVRIDP